MTGETALHLSLRASGHHNLVCDLIEELPLVGEPWSASKRAKWIAAATAIFDLIYTETGKKTAEPATEIPSVEDRRRTIYSTPGASEPQRIVLEALAEQTVGADGWITEPVRVIAQDAGLGATNTNSALDALEKKKLIQIDRRHGDGVNRYKILASEMAA